LHGICMSLKNVNFSYQHMWWWCSSSTFH
jgi:hypothetical protein